MRKGWVTATDDVWLRLLGGGPDDPAEPGGDEGETPPETPPEEQPEPQASELIRLH